MDKILLSIQMGIDGKSNDQLREFNPALVKRVFRTIEQKQETLNGARVAQ